MNKYLALTIGPIYETFNQAHETRTVWAASYFFSWFTRQVLVKSKENKFNVLLPYTDEIAISQWGSGLYADRVYFIVDENTTKDLIDRTIRLTVEELASDILLKIEKKPSDVNEIIDFLDDYLNIHVIEIETEKPVLNTLNVVLDHTELKQYFPFRYDRNYLLDYLNLKVSEGSLLALDAFGKDKLKKRRFRSIPEISTTSLERKHQAQYSPIVLQSFKKETDLFIKLEEDEKIKKDFRQCHKYYAVIYADGDNIGQLLESINDEGEKLKEFSKQLLAFGKLAENMIVEYGGNGIYLGGEDIMAFTPVACITKDQTVIKTLFSLINDLDKCFDDTVGYFASKVGAKPQPTLSFGVMIAYAKYPLKECMQMAHRLMENAKDKDKFPGKNTVGLRFQKHSGQYMECFVNKSETASKEKIDDFITKYCSNPMHDQQENILSGVIQRFKDDHFFKTLGLAADNGRLDAFFQNFFDEKIHLEDEKNIFLQDVRELAASVFADYTDKNECRKILFTILRFVHFLNQKKE